MQTACKRHPRESLVSCEPPDMLPKECLHDNCSPMKHRGAGQSDGSAVIESKREGLQPHLAGAAARAHAVGASRAAGCIETLSKFVDF